jgi:hypothetical protein
MSKYPSDWEARRSKVVERDERCQNCGDEGVEETLHIHHIVPIAAGGSHRLSNLAALCSTCHRATHGQLQSVSDNNDLENDERTQIDDFSDESTDETAEKVVDLPAVPEERPTGFELVNGYTCTDDGPEEEMSYLARRRRMVRQANILQRLKWKVTGVPVETEDE